MSFSLVENECPKCLLVDNFEDLFDKNINCTSYREYNTISPMVIFPYVILHHFNYLASLNIIL